MFRGWRKYVTIAGLLLLVVLGYLLYRGLGNSTPSQTVPITIARETTFLESPVGEDGFIDYWSALQEQASAGVTPENNAAVVLWKVFNPDEIPGPMRDAYFQELGIPVLIKEGRYLESWLEMVQSDLAKLKSVASAHKKLREKHSSQTEGETDPGVNGLGQEQMASILASQAESTPWTEKELPQGEEWMIKYGPQIRLLINGSRLAHCYSPRIQTEADQPLQEMEQPDLFPLRSVYNHLSFYAMGKLGEKEPQAAIEALMASFRWARLGSQSDTMIQWFISSAMERGTLDSLAVVACSGQLSAEELRQLQQEFHDLPDFGSLAEVMDQGERLLGLDLLTFSAKRSSNPQLPPDPAAPISLANHKEDFPLDWNALLIRYNSFVDLQVNLLKTEDFAQRKEAMDHLAQMYEEIFHESKASETDLLPKAGSREAAIQRIFQAQMINRCITPSSIVNLKLEMEAKQQLTSIALALALYRAEKGTYPEQLDDVLPDYWPQAPAEPFQEPFVAAASFVYELQDDGKEFVLSSRGVDGVADEGEDSALRGDDLVVRSKIKPLGAE